MSVIVSKSELLTALNSIKDTVVDSTLCPYSRYLKMTVDATVGKLSITSSDTTSSNTAKMFIILQSHINNSFADFPLFEYRLFMKLVQSLPDQQIEIDQDRFNRDGQDHFKLIINAPSLKTPIVMNAFDPLFFPEIDPDPTTMVGSLKMPAADFMKSVTTLAATIKQSDGLSLTNCIAFKVFNDELCCESYNDKLIKLSLLQTKLVNFTAPPSLNFFIDYFKFKSLLPYIDKAQDVTIDVYTNYALITTENFISKIRFMSGSFPDIKSAIPAQFVANTFVSKVDLLKALNRVVLFANNNEPIKIEINQNELVIEVESYLGHVSESISCATRGLANFIVEVNPRNFIDTLNTYPFDKIMLLYPTAKALVVGTAIARPDFNFKTMLAANYLSANAVKLDPVITSFDDEASLPNVSMTTTEDTVVSEEPAQVSEALDISDTDLLSA